MANLDEKMSAMAEQVLGRHLSDEEQLEIYRISDASGMTNVHSFLYQLLVFKLHEDRFRLFENRLNERFDEIASLETRISNTLEMSVERILGEGAARIGADMGDSVAAKAKDMLSTVAAYHFTRGAVFFTSFACLVSILSYCMGSLDLLRLLPEVGFLQALMFLPAGWCFFLCGLTYTFFWVGDNWNKIRRKLLFKVLLGVQLLVLALLASAVI